MDNRSESLFSGHTGRMSLILAFGWLVALLGRGVISPLLPSVIAALSITPFQAGLVLSLMMAIHSLVQYPAGALSDELSRTTVLAASLIVLAIGFGLLATAVTYWQFLFGGVMVGLGTGLYFTPQRSLLSDMFVERRGRAFGVNFAAGSLGSAMSGGVAILALGVGIWQYSFLPVAVLAILVLVLLVSVSHESIVIRRVRPGLFETVSRIRGSRELVGIIVAYGLFSFAWQGIVGFLPAFLQSAKALSPTASSLGFTLMFVTAMVVMPFAGNLSDIVSRPTVATVALVVAGVGMLALLWASTLLIVLVAIVILAIGLRAFPPVMQAHLMDMVPDDTAGGDFGAIKTVYTLFGSIGPVFVGLVSGSDSYTIAFAGLTLCLLLSIAFIVGLGR